MHRPAALEFFNGPKPSPLGPEDEARLQAFAAANPEAAKRYAEKPVNMDLYAVPPGFTPKRTVALDCPFCRQPLEAIEDKIEDGETVYVAEPCLCYLTKPEFERLRAQIGSWQDYIEDPDCDDPMAHVKTYLIEEMDTFDLVSKPPWWTRAWRWLTGWRRCRR